MDLEARSFSKAELVTLKSKLAEYKAGLNNVKKEAKKASAALPDEVAARQELMERGLGEPLGVRACLAIFRLSVRICFLSFRILGYGFLKVCALEATRV